MTGIPEIERRQQTRQWQRGLRSCGPLGLDGIPIEDLDIVQLRELGSIRISNNHDGVVFALMSIVDELQEVWEELGVGDDDRRRMTLENRGQDRGRRNGESRDREGRQSEVRNEELYRAPRDQNDSSQSTMRGSVPILSFNKSSTLDS